jgi:hypothetical protein
MLRQDFNRIDPKRRNVVDHRKKQFASPTYKDLDYPYRLNFYTDPPTADITLEQFEQWAIDRLRGRQYIIAQQETTILIVDSSRRTRSMRLPQQDTRRDSNPHEAYSQAAPKPRGQ